MIQSDPWVSPFRAPWGEAIYAFDYVGTVYALQSEEMSVIIDIGMPEEHKYVVESVTFICNSQPPVSETFTIESVQGKPAKTLTCVVDTCTVHDVCSLIVVSHTDPIPNIQIQEIRYFGTKGEGGLCYKGDDNCPIPVVNTTTTTAQSSVLSTIQTTTAIPSQTSTVAISSSLDSQSTVVSVTSTVQSTPEQTTVEATTTSIQGFSTTISVDSSVKTTVSEATPTTEPATISTENNGSSTVDLHTTTDVIPSTISASTEVFSSTFLSSETPSATASVATSTESIATSYFSTIASTSELPASSTEINTSASASTEVLSTSSYVATATTESIATTDQSTTAVVTSQRSSTESFASTAVTHTSTTATPSASQSQSNASSLAGPSTRTFVNAGNTATASSSRPVSTLATESQVFTLPIIDLVATGKPSSTVKPAGNAPGITTVPVANASKTSEPGYVAPKPVAPTPEYKPPAPVASSKNLMQSNAFKCSFIGVFAVVFVL
ncbi:hypothetical protein HDU79_005688 [Rhizoclosmatium sp. JEL0117]|nr:hypothetical protein HDU79_005688 [Rhizoclosmatium sp. JEL0117]